MKRNGVAQRGRWPITHKSKRLTPASIFSICSLSLRQLTSFLRELEERRVDWAPLGCSFLLLAGCRAAVPPLTHHKTNSFSPIPLFCRIQLTHPSINHSAHSQRAEWNDWLDWLLLCGLKVISFIKSISFIDSINHSINKFSMILYHEITFNILL